MGRPPMIPPEKKPGVLAILSEEMSIAEAARNEKVFGAVDWPVQGGVIEAGRTAPVAGRSGPSSREAHLVIWPFLLAMP